MTLLPPRGGRRDIFDDWEVSQDQEPAASKIKLKVSHVKTGSGNDYDLIIDFPSVSDCCCDHCLTYSLDDNGVCKNCDSLTEAEGRSRKKKTNQKTKFISKMLSSIKNVFWKSK